MQNTSKTDLNFYKTEGQNNYKHYKLNTSFEGSENNIMPKLISISNQDDILIPLEVEQYLSVKNNFYLNNMNFIVH